MYCVIQEIKTKKPNTNGYPKELKSEYLKMTINGTDCNRYTFSYSYEKFERPIRKSYKISIHHSFRMNGKVKKKQFSLCTVNYYDLADNLFTLCDYADDKINTAADALNVDADEIYSAVFKKLQPLIDKVQHEFWETEEYKAHKEHERIIKLYQLHKKEFAEKYETDPEEYDRCYDVFGTLQNPEYLKSIERNYSSRKEYEQKSSSYYENFYSNYNKNFGSDYCGSKSGSYTDDDKATLKKFYHILCKAFHPDANHELDTSYEMQLINQLKNEWGI